MNELMLLVTLLVTVTVTNITSNYRCFTIKISSVKFIIHTPNHS